MIRFIYCTLLLASLAGCAATGANTSGNFSDAPAPVQQQLADAAVRQLVLLYPPGSTRFKLQQATSDPFGQPLAAGLRASGYALEDFKPASDAQAAAAAPAPAATPSSASGVPLGYVLDQAAGPGLYRIGLLVGSQTLTRVYQAHEGQLVPAGAWVRKE
ncbi:conjugal transfer protein TrbH [Comamonas endophytica]|uniref:Conjugal transfer protein TrbH n=1 Tax=Comamonas endophytica TaxID=2949090 RepID=A0ABY6GFA9_9BURK|nr:MULTISPECIES: conjugal transfer protein TrbH [unclassified Acidovorax]MCD2514404.1 conjugal transfer protein TrbH [Acidovorax sp. D4N7]UYG53694.1 conjugal transfer protein TrbH [Acidovorax sp. 5MLIR]